ncbi:MAG TPA: sigma-70 family RNA polymerase sigma factor [Candidatus Dormibacteraeota bacterium]
MAASDSSERDLALSLTRGEPIAMEGLYDQYGNLAFGLAFRIVADHNAAEDVVAEAFLSVWRNRGSFDASRGSLGGWLLTTVRHVAIARLRATSAVRTETRVDAITGSANGSHHPAELAQREQTRSRLARLPLDQRTTLELAYFEGYTCSEIATRMHVSLGTVTRHLVAGLVKMRGFLEPGSPAFDGYGASSSSGLKISE